MNNEQKIERLSSKIGEVKCELLKIEGRKLEDKGQVFDGNKLRGKYAFEKKEIKENSISANFSLKLFMEGEAFFEIETFLKIECTLAIPLGKTDLDENDMHDLLKVCLPEIDKVVAPLAKSMGYDIKLI